LLGRRLLVLLGRRLLILLRLNLRLRGQWLLGDYPRGRRLPGPGHAAARTLSYPDSHNLFAIGAEWHFDTDL
jgi:hypothetical protein